MCFKIQTPATVVSDIPREAYTSIEQARTFIVSAFAKDTLNFIELEFAKAIFEIMKCDNVIIFPIEHNMQQPQVCVTYSALTIIHKIVKYLS